MSHVQDGTVPDNSLEENDRVYLEKLRLATDILLRMAEDPGALLLAFDAPNAEPPMAP